MRKETEIEEIVIDDQFVVNPNGIIPTDVIVINGFADVNEALITGEALPVPEKKWLRYFCRNFK